MHFNSIFPYINQFTKIRHFNKIAVLFIHDFCRFRMFICHFEREQAFMLSFRAKRSGVEKSYCLNLKCYNFLGFGPKF